MVQRVREIVYASIKDKTGIEPDLLRPAMDLLTVGAQDARVDMNGVYLVTDNILNPDTAAWAEAILVGYAEFVAFGRPVEGILPAEAEAVWVQALKKAAIGRSGGGFDSIGRGLDLGLGFDPSLGGTCKTCAEGVAAPDFPIGSLPAPGTYAFHSSSTSSSGDCNWYSFPTAPGHRYDFRTCAPGSATFDTVIQVFTSACGAQPCGRPWSSDDEVGCGITSAVEVVCPLATTTMYVKVSGFGAAFGSYTLAYREMICPNCASAPLEITPTTTCQYVSDSFVNGGTSNPGCLETWFKVNLVGGQGYVFTTCPSGAGAVCPLANSTPTTFDTELFLYAPLDCTLGTPLASSTGTGTCSTAPTNRALISFTAPSTGQYLLRLRGPFGLGINRFGCYDLGYVQTTVPTCGNCAMGPFLATLTPDATCQTQSGIVTTCQDTWYLINNTIVQPLEFSTCSLPPPDCLGGSNTFDTTIELYNSSCVLIQQDGDSCGGTRDRFCTSTGPGDLPVGTYKLRVRGGGVGSFVLTYRSCGIACTPVSNQTLVPSLGTASSGINTCLKTETFFVTADGSPVVNYAYTITPPPGGTATPPAGGVSGASAPGNDASFTSTLQGEGNYTVRVCATNGCTPIPPCITIIYTLLDKTPPVLIIPADTTVQCTSVPPVPTVTAQDNCDPDPTETFSEVRIDGACDGRYVLERSWSAVDRSGNSIGPLTQTVTVRDDVGPTIVPGTIGVFDYCMWPPNHEMHCFSAADFSPIITDNCSLPTTWKIVGCTNSEEELEPCGDGNQDPDCVISADGQFVCLRSERCGSDPAENDGRIYGLYFQATDACGNDGAATLGGQVVVVHDQSDHSDCILL